MGLESIISIIPTIGNIVGGLLEGLFTEGKDAPLRKYTFRLGASVTDEIDVVNEKGQLSLRNRTPYSLCVSFPAQNGNVAETAIVPSCCSLPLNDQFRICAGNDVDHFNITVAGDSIVKKNVFAGENTLTISAGGTVKVNPKGNKYIGVHTNVSLSETEITISQYDGNGKAEIVCLELQSVGGSGRYSAQDIPMDSKNSVTIPHSLILEKDEEVYVGVTINYATRNISEYMEKNNKRYAIRNMSADEIKVLENTKSINK